jgi:drug/metabolite transporter (DMT)-like permease
MSFETGVMLSKVGIWLVLTSAIALVVTTTIAVRMLPRLVVPLLIVAWVCGIAGFAAVCVVMPTFVNIVLAVLFLASSIFHGLRIMKRVKKDAPCCDDPTHHHE